MIPLAPPFRLAAPEDGPVLAELVNAAGEGLAYYFWSKSAAPGEDPWALGIARQRERAAEGKIVVIDHGDGPVAALTGYEIDSAEPVEELSPVIQPLQALENQALDSWYVNVLAALPDQRGKGHGTALLGLAEQICRDLGRPKLSLIVHDTNTGARDLYASQGYRDVATRAIIREDWETDGKDWILMIKDLA
ncbi:MAG: GNAT family N-acetyltransferase [Pseudomonadota bacterium]